MKFPLFFYLLLFLSLTFACKKTDPLVSAGKSYQSNQDYLSLRTVMEGLEIGADTSHLKALLGKPIDMGFDYRYLLDSTGPQGCVVGAVFHLDGEGKVDDKWIGEICE